jgi:hypothetical protein
MESETISQARDLIQGLYTNFVLRDLAGKIVPGSLLAFSFATLFYPPKDIFNAISRKIPWHLLLIGFGFLWGMVLGLQSLAESVPIPIFGYFPNITITTIDQAPDFNFQVATKVMQSFLAQANVEDKLQYERFVVIKEATGNLFIALVISVPFWLHSGWIWWRQRKSLIIAAGDKKALKFRRWHDGIAAAALAVVYAALLFGLHRMHQQHIVRQFCLAAMRLEVPTVPMPSGVDVPSLEAVCGIKVPPRTVPVIPASPPQANW